MRKWQSNSVNLIPLSLVSIGLFTGGVLASSHVSAEDSSVVDEINITVPVSCTLSGTGMDTHNAEINNGQSNSAIGETILKAFCNDTNGFSIYAIGYTDNEDGKNVLTNTTLGSTYDIVTGTATSGDTSNWAMKLNLVTSPTPTYPIIIAGSTDDTDKVSGDLDYSSFQSVPNDYTKVAYRKASTDINPTGENIAEGSTLKTTYQAYISKTQPAGTYTGQVKYTLVHPHNAAAPEIPEAPSTSCTTPVPNYTYMQDINSTNISSVLNSLEENSPYYLRDKRDNQPYCVAKLKDGKLWMTENLNITGSTALSSEDTDVTSAYISSLTTSNNLTKSGDTIVLPASATKNDANNNLTDSTQFNTDNYAYVFNSGNKENCGAGSQDTPCYSYYSWDAATLGSGRSISTDNTDAEQSICPKNWRLPTSRYASTFDATTAANSDFYNLATNYGMSTGAWSQSTGNFYSQAGPGTTLNFLLAGYYSGGSFYGSGSYGYYWSSTSFPSSLNARFLAFGSSYVSSANGSDRRLGLSVRCLFGS